MAKDSDIDAGTYAALGRISRFYLSLTRLYSSLPYTFSTSGATLPPVHYFMEITRRCNLRCKMCCFIDWLQNTPAKKQAEGELTTEEWLGVIDQTTRYSLITFTGGEVFSRRDFMQILEHACSRRRVHFISNATMLNVDRARQCVELAPKRLGGKGLNFVGTSIDGTRDVHDEIRAQQGAFDKTISGIQNLVRFKRDAGKRCPLIHVNTVIQADNVACLADLPQVVADAGGDILNLLTENRAFDLPTLGEVDPSMFARNDVAQKHIDRKLLADALLKTLKNARRVGIEVRLPRMPLEELLNHYDQGYDLKQFECRAVWINLYIDSRGGVYPCFIKRIGNVRQDTLRKLWNCPEIRAFRVRRREGGFEVCRGCCEMEYQRSRARGSTISSVSKLATSREK